MNTSAGKALNQRNPIAAPMIAAAAIARSSLFASRGIGPVAGAERM